MDFFLHDPNEIRLPPEEVRLVRAEATPQPNGKQVKVHLELTPFMKRPNIEVTIRSASGSEVAHASILETMLYKLEITLHLRQAEVSGDYSMETVLYYQHLPEPSDTPVEMPLPEPMIVDKQTMTFSIPPAKP